MTAPGQSYPAELLDAHGKPILPGAQTIQFTDATLQPGTGGGGGALSVTDGNTTVAAVTTLVVSTAAVVSPVAHVAELFPLPNVVLALQWNAIGATVSGPIVGGSAFSGTARTALPFTSLAAALGQVVSLADFAYALSGMVASTSDPFDLNFTVSVTDATGTNQATCTFGTSLPSPVTDMSATGSLTGGTWTVTAGADLSIAGDVLNSTAGGLYFVFYYGLMAWD